ncbi:MAG: DUF4921 family protein [Patescibacteria group bacterium]|mgnify:CR=1 FL=1
MSKKSELRQDLVSGDWILISPGRLKRPGAFIKKKTKRVATPINKCPDDFEHPLRDPRRKPILKYMSGRGLIKNEKDDEQNWEIVVLQNRYPAVNHEDKLIRFHKLGPYAAIKGAGHHDLVITRDHYLNFARMSINVLFRVFVAFRDRYLTLLSDKNIAYISIFHNWGPGAGASIYHPHSQIIAIPVVPPGVTRSLEGSLKYFKDHRTCVHCKMIGAEKKIKKRIIAENSEAIAFAPYASRLPFEVRVFPKRHRPYFENTYDGELMGVVEVLQLVLKSIEKNLHDPDYNLFIHTSPTIDKKRYRYYHWHIEILPKTNILAGFELGTGVELNAIDPDDAAKILRK